MLKWRATALIRGRSPTRVCAYMCTCAQSSRWAGRAHVNKIDWRTIGTLLCLQALLGTVGRHARAWRILIDEDTGGLDSKHWVWQKFSSVLPGQDASGWIFETFAQRIVP